MFFFKLDCPVHLISTTSVRAWNCTHLFALGQKDWVTEAPVLSLRDQCPSGPPLEPPLFPLLYGMYLTDNGTGWSNGWILNKTHNKLIKEFHNSVDTVGKCITNSNHGIVTF